MRRQYPERHVVGVARDGRARTGRPRVFVADMLALMAGCGHTSAAIANAEVLCMNDAVERLPFNALPLIARRAHADRSNGADVLGNFALHVQAMAGPTGVPRGAPRQPCWTSARA